MVLATLDPRCHRENGPTARRRWDLGTLLLWMDLWGLDLNQAHIGCNVFGWWLVMFGECSLYTLETKSKNTNARPLHDFFPKDRPLRLISCVNLVFYFEGGNAPWKTCLRFTRHSPYKSREGVEAEQRGHRPAQQQTAGTGPLRHTRGSSPPPLHIRTAVCYGYRQRRGSHERIQETRTPNRWRTS